MSALALFFSILLGQAAAPGGAGGHAAPIVLAKTSDSSIPIGSTAQATMTVGNQTYAYTGILVSRTELAPCFATSSKQDVILRGTFKLIAWSRPCPQLPLAISTDAVNRYLRGGISLLQAAS